MCRNASELAREIIDCGVRGFHGEIDSCRGLCRNAPPTVGRFHLPDPWSGNLETARLLIVGVNPGFDHREFYPSLDDSEWMTGRELNYARIYNFFKDRFWTGDGQPPERYQVKVGSDGRTFFIPRRQDGEPPNRYLGYWRYAADIARFILGQDTTIGVDYALTELVHCKTNNVRQIPISCYGECFTRHFGRIIGAAPRLETIVIVGGWARCLCGQHWQGAIYQGENLLDADDLKDHMYQRLELRLNGRSYFLYFADHNNGRGTHRGSVQRFIASAK